MYRAQENTEPQESVYHRAGELDYAQDKLHCLSILNLLYESNLQYFFSL